MPIASTSVPSTHKAKTCVPDQTDLTSEITMNRVAVIGSGISGAVCASNLAGKNAVCVTIFDSARGPGGRMSQRRETTEDGKELVFDHGAPYFTATNTDVRSVVGDWEARGLVAEWKESFGSFDFISRTFIGYEKLYLGWIVQEVCRHPKMNSICRALVSEPGVETKFGVGVGLLEWLEDEGSWSLNGLDGQNLGHFKGVVASDKNVFSPRFTNVTGRPPPLDLHLVPELASKIKEVPVDPCFALMLAFEQPLSSIPMKGFSFLNSKVLSRAYYDSSKPGRSRQSENWVLHSTAEYAANVIAQTGLQKLPAAALDKVAEELFQEFQNTGLSIPRPFFKKAHRWGSAFPAASISEEEKCLWDGKKRLAICGDFCVGPNVEGAILSGLAAGSKFKETFSCLYSSILDEEYDLSQDYSKCVQHSAPEMNLKNVLSGITVIVTGRNKDPSSNFPVQMCCFCALKRMEIPICSLQFTYLVPHHSWSLMDSTI